MLLRVAFTYGEGDPHLADALSWAAHRPDDERLHLVHHADVRAGIFAALRSRPRPGTRTTWPTTSRPRRRCCAHWPMSHRARRRIRRRGGGRPAGLRRGHHRRPPGSGLPARLPIDRGRPPRGPHVTEDATMTATAEHAPAMTIGGVAEEAAAVLPVDNPATGAPPGAAPVCSGRQLDRAMDAALAAAGGWAADDEARRAALLAAAKEVSRAASRLGALVTAEQGKPAAMAIAEAYGAAGALRYHAGLDLGAELLRDDRRGHVELARRPLGVVAAITPWNFPVAIAAAKLAPALRAGNTVVLKPSPYAPLAVLELGRLLAPLFPPGVVNVVSGGDDLGAAMVAHPVPAHVSFTGSVAAGRRVAASAGAGLKRVTLELGGNDPAILLDDADPDAIAEKLFWEAFANSGQACMLVKRLYVPASRHGRVVDALADRARATRVGDGAVKGTELGPLTTAQLRRVTALVEAATAGARVAAGGAPLPGPGRFYAPPCSPAPPTTWRS
ncbi:aldehyde dehydrogenase family protein [Micromonospora sp. BRA006-A]|nr:aldehyde dehydrogenase family protein [Micromonospora sp. BRA006-A]